MTYGDDSKPWKIILQRQETSACLLTKDHFVFRDHKEGMACREKMGYRGATGRTGYLEETEEMALTGATEYRE